MAPNKFDINRTPGVKPGLKTGDIISDLAQIETNDNPETVKQAMLAFDSFIRNGPYFAVQTVGKYIKTTGVILGDEEDKPDVPGDRGKLQRMKFVATIDVNKGACPAYSMQSCFRLLNDLRHVQQVWNYAWGDELTPRVCVGSSSDWKFLGVHSISFG